MKLIIYVFIKYAIQKLLAARSHDSIFHVLHSDTFYGSKTFRSSRSEFCSRFVVIDTRALFPSFSISFSFSLPSSFSPPNCRHRLETSYRNTMESSALPPPSHVTMSSIPSTFAKAFKGGEERRGANERSIEVRRGKQCSAK